MDRPGLIERALCRLLAFTDIQHEGSLYMRRFFLTPKNADGWELVLHKICRPDVDAAHHDHPGDFATLVLRGGYIEKGLLPDGQECAEAVTAGNLRFRSATFAHRIDRILGNAAWTLCLRRRVTNPWGFWRADQKPAEWTPADEYFRPGYERAPAPQRDSS